MAPKTEEQLQELRQERRQKILEAALELFALSGFHATSISKIAQKAGISKGLIYNYFESKDQMLDAIIEGAMQEGDSIINQGNQQDPGANLKLMIEAFFTEMKQNQHYWKLVSTLGLRAEFPKINQLIRDRLMAYMEIIKQMLQQIGIENPGMEAKVLGATFDGIALHYLLGGEEYPLEDVKNYLIDKYTKNQAIRDE